MFRANRHNVGLECKTKSCTQKHLKKFTDVNYMIQRAIAGDASVFRHGFSADVSEISDDVQELLNASCRGREAFDALPPEIKEIYPTVESFLSALSKPEEKERLTKLGVFKAESVEQPIAVRVIPEGNQGSTPAAPANT